MLGGSPDPIITVSGAGVNSVAYVDLLWRPFQIGATPSGANDRPKVPSTDEDSDVEIIPAPPPSYSLKKKEKRITST